MFHQKTVFVVGAGASAEARLPTGNGLASKISSLLSIPGDWALIGEDHKPFANALSTHCEPTNDLATYLESMQFIVRTLPAADSIDEFIYTYRDDRLIALISKAAIAHTILKAERDSLFCSKQFQPKASDPLVGLRATWYPSLGKLITQNIAADEIDRLFENITIICFNYDRCIEEFLAHFLALRYALELPQSRQIVSRLDIIRPYGMIGPLSSVAFGDTGRLQDSFELSQNIYTFTEQNNDHSLVSKIKEATSEARTIIFLGFGFHHQNIELLRPERPAKAQRILASGRGIKPPNAATIARELQQLFGPRAIPQRLPVTITNNGDCRSLFEAHSRSMNPAA